ncbi:MAG: ATP-binding cassette domain-containing protein, partial [Anaerolineales bacterium]|nr:ATP-binding cassette domain-containing protein [Anaerolineales bacterium]
MEQSDTVALRMQGITKRFPGVLANDRISLDCRKGEVLGLLGENGAGKTTLMNILYGLHQPDSGEIFVNGEQVKIESPAKAIQLGIGMVHQHFKLV